MNGKRDLFLPEKYLIIFKKKIEKVDEPNEPFYRSEVYALHTRSKLKGEEV